MTSGDPVTPAPTCRGETVPGLCSHIPSPWFPNYRLETVDWCELFVSTECEISGNVGTLFRSPSWQRESKVCAMDMHPGRGIDLLKDLRSVVPSLGTGCMPIFVF